ncbi:MAG: Uma2 family endonuclease [Gemmataceae bacterium]|nr:Uma2 family endonuclease [Gemmataceae bacterium]
MSTDVPTATDAVVYPDSDGQPMADNTLQWDWMVKIVGELREMFSGQQVFVAGDLLWYPVEGDPKIRTAPDALVAFGRPPGYRGSYKQWEEDGVAPQVVFEVLSPNNTREEMREKLAWYERYGVQEYYLIDPYKNHILASVRGDDHLQTVYPIDGFRSPLLGIRFEENGELKLYAPDGREFRTREERVQEIQEELRKTAEAFEEQRQRAIEERNRADEAEAARELLKAKLRELGVNPDDVLKPAG